MGKGSKKKPPPEKPDWKKLEQVMAEVQKFLAPKAEIRLDHHVKGRSGRMRQLDVTLSQKIGNVPIFIAIECKRYTRSVGIEKVEAFATKLKDVKAFAGVMISSKGFDAGAKAVAAQENILLQTYRDADETDWRRYVGSDSWMILIGNEYEVIDVSVVLPDKKRFDNIPYNMILFNENSQHYKEIDGRPWDVTDMFLDGWEKAPRPREIGEIEFTLGRARPPIFIKYKDTLLPTDYFIIHARMNPKKYSMNIQFTKGELLESSDTGKLEYIKATFNNLDVREAMNNQEGIPYSRPGWEAEEKAKKIEFSVDREAKYLIHLEAGLK